MQIPVLNGITTDENSDFRTSYPRNLVPVPKQQGISAGYLRPSDGMIEGATGPGTDRGAENWEEVCYRVMGTKLVSVDSSWNIAELGDVAGTGQCSLDYSFDRLAVSSSGKLFYWDKTTLTEVTDPDLGAVVDFIWIDGFWMTTDGENLVVTELADPTSVDPLKYGSSEVDPDPILALLKVRNEAVALNKNTIEFFKNRGLDGFPFQRIDGAQIKKGVVGTHACVVIEDVLAFVGSGRDEAPAVYIAENGSHSRVSTREIDQIFEEYTESELSQIVCEKQVEGGFIQMHIRLPDQTLVYYFSASRAVGEPVWGILTSGVLPVGQNRACNRVWCYDKYIVGDPQSARIGYLTDATSEHWGEKVGWEFGTGILYNEGRRAIVHELELVALTGRSELGSDPTIFTEYSKDGETWSNPKFAKAGKQGDRSKRIVWWNQGFLDNWRVQRFSGTSDSHLSVARLEAQVEPLSF